MPHGRGCAIEVDPTLAENPLDKDYESSGYATSTKSLAAAAAEYIYENGRRYHAYYGVEKNLMPTDEMEQERLDINHEIFMRLLEGGLHKAPLRNPKQILDVGTGTGIWAIDMADQHPNAKVTGIDLSPIQPKWVPANCKFLVDDAELEWTINSDTLDFVHFRNLALGISNWSHVLSETYRCLQPGGYVELADTGLAVYCDDGSMWPDNPVNLFCELLLEAMARSGRESVSGDLLSARLTKAGFVDIKVYPMKQPFGPWAKERRLKEVGMLTLLQSEAAFLSYGMAALTRVLGMDHEVARKICHDGYQATMNKNTHMYGLHYIVYGRKPVRSNLEVRKI
ncbi:S-adenosyl-L-methionine-dependent methyltransferase [Tricharina praecox]|uniref:S-adenosyl-L-methionine-dependent methyltransferase n=1 Tax=Tricharina praecox TaxID=43433 RepID=UPI00222025BD|nr:S-adenosyl-L-methionine-dependent methyltransferase [Tricharina praecox]KAI5844901.1 S-adenosyl-L-methionine-dependent methyltransferase [Tricharina praecox]